MPGMSFVLPGSHPALAPILEIIPVQVIAYKLAEMRGITPGSVRYISKIIREEGGGQ
jgi:glucosamine 6-phosphate synthetase-like amidotransferase/phosphosugar isomerase protein